MTVTLVLQAKMAAELDAATEAEVETACVLLARQVRTPGGHLRLLARELHWVPDHAYLQQSATTMTISSHGYVPALATAEADGTVPIWLHTHPGRVSSPRPSQRDRRVDEELADLFRLRSGNPWYGAVILARPRGRLAFSGHIATEERRTEIDRIWITGQHFALHQNWLHRTTPLQGQFDRNIRAFGVQIQRVLGDLSVAVVGCGGTGSAVIEQLARLGVRRFLLFDPDTLSEGNLTRVYGSSPQDLGRAKVKVMADHVHRIAPAARVATAQASVTAEPTAKLLLDADVIFGCTDDNAGRLVLSRFASYLLTPVIDCGVLLSSRPGGQLFGIDGRVTVLAPGEACLVCRNRIDLRRAAAELLSPEEHRRLAAEGYAPGLPGVEPAVVAYTTLVAATAVGELLERLIHYGPELVPSEILLRAHERELSTNKQQPCHGHYCHPDTRKLGLGVTRPFLEQMWQT